MQSESRAHIGFKIGVVLMVFLLPALALTRESLDFQLTLIAVVCPALVLFAAYISSSTRVYDPIMVLFYLVYFGVSVRLVALLANLRSDHPSSLVVKKLLNNQPSDVLLAGAFAMLLGIVAVVIGYLGGNFGMDLSKSFLAPGNRLSNERLRQATWFFGALGLLGFVLMVGTFGIDTLSAKRFNDLTGGSQARIGATAYLYYRLSLFLRFPLYLLLIRSFQSDRVKRYSLWVAGLLALAVPIYINNRAGAMLILVDVLFISFVRRKRVKLSAVVGLGTLAVALLVFMLTARSGSSDQAFENLLYSRDLLNVSSLAQVVQLSPGTLGGQTLYGWVLAPLPFESQAALDWAYLGRLVWTEAYGGTGINGVPPGFFGELFLSFGWVGIAIGAAIFGVSMRFITNTFRSRLDSPVAALLYIVLVSRLTLFTLSNNLGTGVLKAFGDAVPLILILMWCNVRAPARKKVPLRTADRVTPPVRVPSSVLGNAQLQSGRQR